MMCMRRVAWPAASRDSGAIAQLFTKNANGGHLAVVLNGSYPNADSSSQCPSSND
jgi:hypothetical protein